jgi:hypothetical protein
MQKAGRGGHRPVHGPDSASRAHLVVGLAGNAAAVTGAGVVTGADFVVRTTVKPGPGFAGFATPMTLPSESRRKAADCAGTIPMLTALDAMLTGAFDAASDWLRASWVSVSCSEVARRSCRVKEPWASAVLSSRSPISPADSKMAQMMPNDAPPRLEGAPVTTRSLGVVVVGRFRARVPTRAADVIWLMSGVPSRLGFVRLPATGQMLRVG